MEAMACGIPTLSTNVGPLSKTIGQTGWVVKKNSVEALAEKLILIIQNKNSIKTKSILARERIVKISSKIGMLKEYNLSYELLLKQK